MKTSILILLFGVTANGARFEYSNGLQVEAKDFKTAAKHCFFVLTKNKYPGEEKGLEIIDICVNGRQTK